MTVRLSWCCGLPSSPFPASAARGAGRVAAAFAVHFPARGGGRTAQVQAFHRGFGAAEFRHGSEDELWKEPRGAAVDGTSVQIRIAALQVEGRCTVRPVIHARARRRRRPSAPSQRREG